MRSWCSRRTSLRPRPSTPTRTRRSSRRISCRKDGSASTSAPRLAARSRRESLRRARFSGTARWGFSNGLALRRGRRQWPEQWPMPTRTPLSGVATPCGRSRSSVSRTGSTGSRPEEGRRSSFSRARSFPAWPRSPKIEQMLIAGNWKMFKTPSETAAFCRAFSAPAGVDVVLCPPYTSLREAVESGLTVYAQNVHWEGEGAYTGEVSVKMLLEVGVAGAIVGHSERRQYFGETDETVRLRVEHALEAGLRVIACVGELEHEREGGETDDVLRRQVSVLPRHERLVVAYEPVW